MNLTRLQFCSIENDVANRLKNVMDGLVRIFRKAIAEEGFIAGPIKLKNTDLNRVHGLVHEIDSRRVFYEFFGDEAPEFCRKSVNETRVEVRSIVKGVWADPSEERIVQEILHALAEFETACARIQPFPEKTSDDPKFFNFVTAIAEMRIKVWSLIAYLKKNGDVINPLHMPKEIMVAVSKAELP